MLCPHCSPHTSEHRLLRAAAEIAREMLWPRASDLHHRKRYHHGQADPYCLRPNTTLNHQIMQHTWCYRRPQLQWRYDRMSLARDLLDSTVMRGQLAHFHCFPSTTQCRRLPIHTYVQHRQKFLSRNGHHQVRLLVRVLLMIAKQCVQMNPIGNSCCHPNTTLCCRC